MPAVPHHQRARSFAADTAKPPGARHESSSRQCRPCHRNLARCAGFINSLTSLHPYERESPLMVTFLNPDSLHPPGAAYSHCALVTAGSDLVFISGQIGMRPDGSLASGI